MKFHVLTLFPEMVEQGLKTSIIGRAAENNLIEIHALDIRNFTADKHGKVDDYTYGGGAGMLMQAQPVYDAWQSVAGAKAEKDDVPQSTTTEPDGGISQGKLSAATSEDAGWKKIRTIYVTPQGLPFNQRLAEELAGEEELIFLCGHYEGIDARVLDEIVTDHVSIGDYVLTGGELPAMVMIDAISRLVPGVLHNDESAETESFHRYLLEYPQYSRPEEWHGQRVPEVLLSGNHRKVSEWRREQSERLTKERRPDLYARYLEQEKLIQRLSANKRHNIHMMESLARGRGEILADESGNTLIYDRISHVCMWRSMAEEGAEKFLRFIPKETEYMLLSQIFLRELIVKHSDGEGRCGTDKAKGTADWGMAKIGEEFEEGNECRFEEMFECKQACYTQKNPLPVRHKDIRPLGEEDFPYVTAHYFEESREYLWERLKAGMLFGAFVEEKLVGFAGWHAEGDVGILYVEEAFRRRGLGASLEAFCINRQLEWGYVPYAHIRVDNEKSLKMQEKLGLYLSKESLWWMKRKR